MKPASIAGRAGATLNLSTGDATSFIELAERISRQLGWAPKVSLEEGIRRCWSFVGRWRGVLA